MSDLKKAIQKLSKKSTGFDAILELAIIKSVNKSEMTCSVVLYDDKNLVLEEVKLKPVVPSLDATEMGVVIYPVVGSYVIIGQINNNDDDLFVVSCSKAESISVNAGPPFNFLLDLQNGSLAMTVPQLSFNGGKQGGLPMVNPLLAKLNQLEDRMNGLISDFKEHKHPGVAPGAGISGIPDKTGPSAIVKTNLTEIENKSILQ
jgi:hypothetical protein